MSQIHKFWTIFKVKMQFLKTVALFWKFIINIFWFIEIKKNAEAV